MRWYKWLINFFTAWFRPKKLPNATDRVAARYFVPAPGMRAWLYTDEAGRIEPSGECPALRLEHDGSIFALSSKGDIIAYDIEDSKTADEFKKQLEHRIGPLKIMECNSVGFQNTLVYSLRECCIRGDGDTLGEALLWAMVDVTDRQGKGDEDDRT